MALEFICSRRTIERKKIVLPRVSSNGGVLKYKIYRTGENEREIAFFYADGKEKDVFALNNWTVPKGARKMAFRVYKEHGQNILNAPVFYDSEEKILKIGNR
ncbi:hypothetical protein A3K73_06025 [Candidatus Pacearchaeota archaeon RBG_13_36_9]|nr:MAG: hypothetical protein A3K73_06025 [Candidatus Pacearchaeota archaeon RBG_13_36_9]